MFVEREGEALTKTAVRAIRVASGFVTSPEVAAWLNCPTTRALLVSRASKVCNVMRSVRSVRYQRQVLNTIVDLHAVQVMDVFSGEKWASKMLLHDQAVLEHFGAIDTDVDVSVVVNVDASTPVWRFFTRPKLSYTGSRAKAMRFPFGFERLFALLTGAFHPSIIQQAMVNLPVEARSN
jgi:hypothetical protein